MQSLNDSNIDSFLDSNHRVIAMFSATWCGPCKTLKPKFEKAAEAEPGITFAYCDIETAPRAVADLQIMSVPTVISFFDGFEANRFSGNNEAEIHKLLEDLKNRANPE